jgi:hypothetical protein
VTVEKTGAGFAADCLLRLDTGIALQASGKAHEPIIAFDVAAERVEKRLRRYKRRLKSYGAENREPPTDIAYKVVAAIGDDTDEEVPEDFAPAVVAETTMALKKMSVASAVIQLDTKDDPVFVFRNVGNGEVNIVYRRADGNIGWIDTSALTRKSGGKS